MPGLMLLVAIFITWRAVEGCKSRKDASVSWRSLDESDAALAAGRASPLVELPDETTLIASCYETLEQLQESWAALQAEERERTGQADSALLDVLYTWHKTERAVLYRFGDTYCVSLQQLCLSSRATLRQIYEPGMRCGEWRLMRSEDGLTSREEAERIARSAIRQMN